MRGLLVAAAGAYGVWLCWTAQALGWRGFAPGPRRPLDRRERWRRLARRTSELLGGNPPAEVLAVAAVAAVAAGAAAYAVFGGAAAPAAAAVLSAIAPVGAARSRAEHRRAEAADAWPGLLEQLRLETGALGRSIPQALVEVGRRAPPGLRPAFRAAEHEWRRSTDAGRMLDVLAQRLADPTGDVVCETLLVAHEVGGAGLDGRLRALVEDRAADVLHRKDARARQAGVRFARRFVLAVPAGMAAAGLSIGTGRQAYGTSVGQALVVTGLVAVAVCWIWAGRLLRLPAERRVFGGRGVVR